MKNNYVLFSVAILLMLISPMAINPTVAASTNGPIPIQPGSLPPINPLSTSPIIPTSPNLGTDSLLPVPSVFSISQVQSGLVASDPLNNEIKTQQQLQANPGSWSFFGDAIAENAPYDFFKDLQGLHIGVQAPVNGTYAGFFAESPNTNAMLFHAVVTTPVSTIPSKNNFYFNGMYVQTSNGLINYVTCVSDTGIAGTEWAVVSVTGNVNFGTTFTTLFVDTSPNQPLTRDCTIITNGDNYLKVFLDGVMVYQSNTLNLQMPAPFNVFLEPQTNYAGQLLNGIYKDYYATSDENIQVTNNPPLAARVDLVSPTDGHVLATAPVGSSATATIAIGQYHMPLGAYIKVYDSNGIQLASTSGAVNIFGGDVYSVNLPLAGL